MKTFKFWDNAPARTAIILFTAILTASAAVYAYTDDDTTINAIAKAIYGVSMAIAGGAILVGFFVGVYNVTRKKK